MTAVLTACILAAILFLLIMIWMEKDLVVTLMVIVLMGICIRSCATSKWYAEVERAQAIEDAEAAKPHVIREYDGCKVYAFRTDRDHYFTRCGNTVSTETNWSTSCGKNCTKQESDTIVTEGNK